MSTDPLRNGDIYRKFPVKNPDLFRPYMPDPLQDPNKPAPPRLPHQDEELIRDAKLIQERFNALYRATPSIKDIFSSSMKAKQASHSSAPSTPHTPHMPPASATSPYPMPSCPQQYSPPHFSPAYPYVPPYPHPYYYSPQASPRLHNNQPPVPHDYSNAYVVPISSAPPSASPLASVALPPAVLPAQNLPLLSGPASPLTTADNAVELTVPEKPAPSSPAPRTRTSRRKIDKHDDKIDHANNKTSNMLSSKTAAQHTTSAVPSRRSRMTAGDSLANLATLAKRSSSVTPPANFTVSSSRGKGASTNQQNTSQQIRGRGLDTLLAAATPPPKKTKGRKPKEEQEVGEVQLTKPSDSFNKGCKSAAWSDEERKLLTASYNRIPLNTSNFWEAVSSMIPHRTAEECQKQWFQELEEADAKKKATKRKKKDAKESKAIVRNSENGKKKKYTRAQLQTALEQTFRGRSDDAYEHVMKKHRVEEDARLAAGLDTQKNALLSLRSPTDKISKPTESLEEDTSEFPIYSTSAAYANKLVKQSHGAAAVAIPAAAVKKKAKKSKLASEDIDIEDGGGDYHITGKVTAAGKVQLNIDDELQEIEEYDSLDEDLLFIGEDI